MIFDEKSQVCNADSAIAAMGLCIYAPVLPTHCTHSNNIVVLITCMYTRVFCANCRSGNRGGGTRESMILRQTG